MFTDPMKNLEVLGLHNGLIVADIGAGIGFYSIPIARAVGPDGKVYALEVQKELLERLKREADHAHVHNVEVIWSNVEKAGGTKLRDQLIDVALLSNVFFQIEDKTGCIKEIARIMKPGGRLLFIDWSESFGGMGPHPDQVVSKQKALEFFTKEYFEMSREFSAGAHHYGILFKRK